MQVHVFLAQGWQGFTPDETGANLPEEKGPWQRFKIIRVERGETPRIGVSGDAILDGIAGEGFYVQPSRRDDA